MSDIAGPPCHEFGIQGYGNPDYGVAIVGVAPGRDELRTGIPFQGQTGKLLDAILSGTGWRRDWTYTTNLTCWRPQDGSMDRDPSNEEILGCIDRLELELTIIKPKLVICLGAIAAPIFTGRPLKETRGAVIWKDDHYVLPTYHPAAALHGSFSLTNDIVRDFMKIKAIVAMPGGGPLPFTEYIIATAQQGQRILDDLAHKSRHTGCPIALDVETTNKSEEGIDVYTDRLICLSISDGESVWFMDAALVNLLDWPTEGVRWTFQNGMFDVQALMRHSNGHIRLPIAEDTMLQSYSLEERGGYHGLKKLSREYLAAPFYEEAIHKFKGTMNTAPPEVLRTYNEQDTVYTQRLQPIFQRMQQQDNTLAFYRDILLPCANAFTEILYEGIGISQDHLATLEQDWLPRRIELQSHLVSLAQDYGWEGIVNLRSPKQLSRLLYGVIGLDGGPSTDQAALEKLDHPFVDDLLLYRTVDHMVNTYLFGVKDDIKFDGCVHPHVLLHGTRTGRPSYTEPPIQTIPTAKNLKEDFGRIRFIFAPKYPDTHVIMEADYAQAEVWTAYGYSQDQHLLADLQSGDYHGRVCSTAFHLIKSETPPLAWDYYRTEAKKITFGVMYGSAADGLAHTMKCDKATAQEYLDNFFGRYTDYNRWIEETQKQVHNNGEMVSVSGRKRRFPLLYGPEATAAMRQSINFPVQSTASDHILLSVIKLHTLLKAYHSRILFTVHDSIVMEVHKDYLHQVSSLVREVMTEPKFPNFPSIPVDIKWGPTWGEAHAEAD